MLNPSTLHPSVFPTTRKPNYSVEIGKLKMTFLISSIFSQLITTPNRLARRSR